MLGKNGQYERTGVCEQTVTRLKCIKVIAFIRCRDVNGCKGREMLTKKKKEFHKREIL